MDGTHTEQAMQGDAREVSVRYVGTVEALTKFTAALCRARLNFTAIERDRIGQYGGQRFPYATLGSLARATLDHLAKEEIAVMGFPAYADGKHRMELHIIGHGLRIETGVPIDMKDIIEPARDERSRKAEWLKEYGKAQTYLLRYFLRAFLFLDSEPDADEDEDQTPVQRRPEPRREAPRPEPRPEAKKPAAATPPPAAAKPDPMAEKLATPAAGPDPDDDPVDKDLEEQFKVLLDQASAKGLGKIKYSAMCANIVNMPPTELKTSAKATRRMMGVLREFLGAP